MMCTRTNCAIGACALTLAAAAAYFTIPAVTATMNSAGAGIYAGGSYTVSTIVSGISAIPGLAMTLFNGIGTGFSVAYTFGAGVVSSAGAFLAPIVAKVAAFVGTVFGLGQAQLLANPILAQGIAIGLVVGIGLTLLITLTCRKSLKP